MPLEHQRWPIRIAERLRSVDRSWRIATETIICDVRGGRRSFFINDERGLIAPVPTGSLVTIRASFVDMKKNINGTNSVKTLERDLKIASSILEWEMGDIWGHIGARLAGEWRRRDHGQIDSCAGG